MLLEELRELLQRLGGRESGRKSCLERRGGDVLFLDFILKLSRKPRGQL